MLQWLPHKEISRRYLQCSDDIVGMYNSIQIHQYAHTKYVQFCVSIQSQQTLNKNDWRIRI